MVTVAWSWHSLLVLEKKMMKRGRMHAHGYYCCLWKERGKLWWTNDCALKALTRAMM